MQALSEIVAKAQSSPAETRAIEQKFIAFLKSDATPGGKDFICKQLSIMGIGGVRSRAGRGPWRSEDRGIGALRPGADPRSGRGPRACARAWPRPKDRTRIGIINTLGVRRDAASVAALRPLALGTDPADASAALYALAKIADPAAVAVLSEAQGKTKGAVHADAAEAYLQAANRLTERGSAASALPIYKTLYATRDPGTVQAAALRGLAHAGGAQATPVLMEALRGSDARLQAIAIAGLMPGSAGQLIAEMPKLERGGPDPHSRPARRARRCVRAAGVHHRLQGLEQAGTHGRAARHRHGGECFRRSLARRASPPATTPPNRPPPAPRLRPDSQASRSTRPSSKGIAGAEPKVRLELIRAAGERGTTAASPVLVKMARDANPDVRRESLRALQRHRIGQ